jgi:3-oxoacyl-[acyl-carrier protein] reductase
MDILKDDIAIITGASSGIGRAVAVELAKEGATVVVNYKEHQDNAYAVVAEITAAGGLAVPFQTDVTREEEVRSLLDFTLREFGRIDVLVNNAGIVRDQLVAAMTLDEWEEVTQTHMRGTFLCIREAVRPMMSRKRGSIINISSVAAERGSRGHCNYAAAKGGINALTRALAVELAPKKIRVNAVSPGVILTGMTKRIRDLASEEILKNIPLRRYGEPDEVARAVRFLASQEASYITGAVLPVTGGLGL